MLDRPSHRRALTQCAVIAVMLGGGLLGVASTVAASQDPVDYSDPATWLCRPGRDDACAVDQTTTVIDAAGGMTPEEWRADPDASIDCFYVYPTVSRERALNSSINAGPGERGVVVSQLARFASRCRLFAPLYRQITLAALMSGGGPSLERGDRELGYGDVLDAWNDYLARDNGGRGVVLIGHSQGSSVLTRLIREEIDGKPIQSQIVSAILLGWNVLVPEGADVGGDFQEMPLCRSRDQVGCVVTYVSFRETAPPPRASLFGRARTPGMEVACTNPAALGGGEAELKSYLAADRGDLPPWVTPEREVETPFVRAPGLLFGECVSNEQGSYLSVRIADATGARTNVIGGDIRGGDGSANPIWGLHLIDVSLGMGDLIDLVGEQTEAYLRQAGR